MVLHTAHCDAGTRRAMTALSAFASALDPHLGQTLSTIAGRNAVDRLPVRHSIPHN